MTSKTIVSGKHPLTVRIDEETYADLRRIAAEENKSVNELIADWSCEMVKRYYRKGKPK